MPISMTPDQYFDAFVLRNYEDFIDNPGCVRHALNAAVAASQMADHYFAYYKRHEPSKVNQYKTFGDYIEQISRSTNGHFRNIRSISTAYKHLYTDVDPNKAKYSSVASAGAIETLQFSNEEVEKIYEDFSDRNCSAVIYTTKSGQQCQFMIALKAVVEYWEKQFS